MLVAITYPMKRKRIKVAKWGTQKKDLKKTRYLIEGKKFKNNFRTIGCVIIV
jgi:hypothetical protein